MKPSATSLRAFIACSSLVTLAPQALQAFAEVARGGLTLDTQVSMNYDSNFLGATKVGDDDYYLSLNPQLNYRRRAGIVPTDIFAGVDILRYDTYDSFDSENFSAGLTTKFPTPEGARLTGSLALSYRESTDVDLFVSDRVASKATTVSISAAYQLGLKTSLTESLSYTDTKRSIYSDQEIISNNLGFLYSNFLGQTSFGLNYQFTDNTSSGSSVQAQGLDQRSHAFSSTLSRPLWGPLSGGITYGYQMLDRSTAETTINQAEQNGGYFSLSLNGPFLPPSKFPKLKTRASLSYQESTTPGINDTGGKTLTGGIGMSWDARERTSLSIDLDRSLQLSAANFTVENTSASFGITERIGDFTSLSGSISQTWNTFRGVNREDKIFRAIFGARRSLSKAWGLGFNYTYEDNKTDADASAQLTQRINRGDYTRHLVSLSANYSF